jgi:hypothetical protein
MKDRAPERGRERWKCRACDARGGCCPPPDHKYRFRSYTNPLAVPLLHGDSQSVTWNGRHQAGTGRVEHIPATNASPPLRKPNRLVIVRRCRPCSA